MRDADLLKKIFEEHEFIGVIHFAAKKAVGESCHDPFLYYENNIMGTINLLEVMNNVGLKNILFSSSATVYDAEKNIPPFTETDRTNTTNPYGTTKLVMEYILKDMVMHKQFRSVVLRYFNPIGAHKSGKIGENPNGIPNNLIPYITQVAVGKLEYVRVFGDDYETKDGTGVRDYIHVLDLALGHIKAIKKFEDSKDVRIYNLGTGEGYSVLDMIKNFEEVIGKKIKYVVTPRRSGDIAECYADSSKAKNELGWEAKYGIREMCEDSWRWQVNNPNGYED